MRVVVTGSSGFIGRHLVPRLRRAGLDVLTVRRASSSHTDSPAVPCHFCDPAHPDSYLPTGHAGEPFTLVHLAWEAGRPAQFTPHVAQVLWLARWCDHWTGRGLQAVVMPGSAEEYGQRDGVLREDDPPQGRLSAYALGKAGARGLLEAWSAASGASVWWLRPFIVYGPGQSGDMAVPYAVRQFLRGQPADFSDGGQQRDFVYIDDAISAFEAAVCSPRPGFRVVNVGTGEPVAVRAVLGRLGELLGAVGCCRFGAVPRRPGEPSVQVADTSRAARLLPWRAGIDWREGIGRLAEALAKPQAPAA
jgi:nucleoside-diphosphate-sugar epimerase